MTESKNPTAAVLVIGNEILSGRTPDGNINSIARKLCAIGVRLLEARVVPDIESDIVAAVNALRARYTYVFTTGGLGATHDDITVDSIAKTFDVPVIEHPEAKVRLVAHYKSADLNAARLRMARIPQGATLIDNPVSAAPGFRLQNVYVLPGVPEIMQAMLDSVTAGLKHGPAIHSISISGHVAENTIADELAAIASRYPQFDIGSYPWFRQGRFGTALVVRGTDLMAIESAAGEITALVRKHDSAAEVETIPPSAA